MKYLTSNAIWGVTKFRSLYNANIIGKFSLGCWSSFYVFTKVLKYPSLNALWQNRVSAVIDHDVHEAGEGEEEVDGGVTDVGDILGLADVALFLKKSAVVCCFYFNKSVLQRGK